MDSATNSTGPAADGVLASSPGPAGALVVMGVAGCGKSSVGSACARSLGWTLFEGDDYHAPESLAKMRQGMPLTDADREGWLDRLGRLLADNAGGAVLTCSALKRRYRDQLRAAVPGLRFAFLDLDRATAFARVSQRPGHVFPPSLVDSQFATLESPVGEPGVLRLDATAPLEALVAEVSDWLRKDAR